MPLSAAEELVTERDRRAAVLAESLYLANLLLIPVVPFVALVLLYIRHANEGDTLAANHTRQALAGSLWAGILLVIVGGASIGIGGPHNPNTWMVVLTYLVTCHAALVLAGMIGLARAMAGRTYRYPIIGPTL